MADGWLHAVMDSICRHFGRPDGAGPFDDTVLEDVDRRLTDVERAQREQAIRLRLLERQADTQGFLRDD